MEETREVSFESASGPVAFAAKAKRKPRAKKVVVETPVEEAAEQPAQAPEQPAQADPGPQQAPELEAPVTLSHVNNVRVCVR